MRHSKIRTLISISGVIGVLVLFHYLKWLDPVEQTLRRALQPPSRVLYRVSVNLNNDTENFQSVEELKEAYREAKLSLVAASQETAACQITKTENKELREQLDFLQKITGRHIGAEVIGKNMEPIGNTIVINRGAQAGMKNGLPVVAGSGVLVGKVIRVEPTLSIVELLNDPRSKVAAAILNGDKSIGLVTGGYGISVRMDFIPQNETIHVGDAIVTSGLEPDIPKGLMIGTVEAVEKEAYQPFQRAVISPAVNLDKLDMVSIIVTP